MRYESRVFCGQTLLIVKKNAVLNLSDCKFAIILTGSLTLTFKFSIDLPSSYFLLIFESKNLPTDLTFN